MAEELQISDGSKQEKYETLLPQIESLLKYETDEIANMANITAMLHLTFGHWWTGFYRVVGDELILGPFQGPLACTRIVKGRGVCGTAWAENRTVTVPDVDKFPGHIACSSASRSEIVVPIRDKNGEVTAVLDIDSDQLDSFDSTDAHYLQLIASLVSK